MPAFWAQWERMKETEQKTPIYIGKKEIFGEGIKSKKNIPLKLGKEGK